MVRIAFGPPGGRANVIAADVLLAAWAVSWLIIAVLIASEVRGLSDLGRTVTTAGGAVEQTGRLMSRLGSLPVVGPEVARSAERVVDAGRQAQRSGRASRRSVRRLSILLAVAIAALPSAPLVLYIPWRRRLARERRALRCMAADGALADPAVLEVLARRAAERLPYRRLLEVSSDPWADIRAGRHRALAEAELERLGVTDPVVRRGVARR